MCMAVIIVSMLWIAMIVIAMIMRLAVWLRGFLGVVMLVRWAGRCVVLMRMCVAMSMVAGVRRRRVMIVLVAVAIVFVLVAHASVPVDGSAICSSMSLRTSLMWASAAE